MRRNRGGEVMGIPALNLLGPTQRPILFSGEMVRAILSGRKTQTRRAIRGQDPDVDADLRCPYGAPGGRLWVRETFAADPDHPDALTMPEYEGGQNPGHLLYRADARKFGSPTLMINGNDVDRIRWRPSIFMPRWASRITLEVQGVRVERVQAITEDDARAEGAGLRSPTGHAVGSARENFAMLWDRINAERAPWSSNPWVWVVVFRSVR